MSVQTTRRQFVAGGGSLALAFSLPAEAQTADAYGGSGLPGDLKKTPKVSAWLRIDADGKVRLQVGKVEIGQGILTAYAQLCADELDIDLRRLEIVSGDTAIGPNQGTTAGSFSMPSGGVAVRQVSAEARQILLSLAARKLGGDPAQLIVEDGTVKAPGGASATYWDLVRGDELAVDATGKAPLKARGSYRYIGQDVPRLDIPLKATAAPIWIQDLRPEGMVHGRVLRPPAYRATLASCDTAAAEAMPGVIKVVRDGGFLGVVATREEQAIAALEALRAAAKWDVPAQGENQDTVYDWLQANVAKTTVIKDAPATNGPEPAAVVEATYRRPFQMHGSIGPSTALAQLDSDGVMHIQSHTQSIYETCAAIAQMLGMDPAKVHGQHVQGSGCYGHNGMDDAAADAALLARALPGRPVRVQWLRGDEHRWEPYGSAMLVKTRATLTASGDVIDWTLDLWSQNHSTRPGRKAGNLLPAWSLEKPFAMPTPRNSGPPNYAADRNAIALYDFPGQKVTTHFVTAMAARSSAQRSLGAYANVFAIESFIDELAHRAKADPVEFRLRYLKDERGRAVLQKAADMLGWGSWKKAEGRGRGIAFARYKGLAAYNAVAMEVDVDRDTGRIRVLRAVSANDSGEVVSPDGVRNQIEGGMIQSLSWTLKEAVRFDASGVKSVDWASYPILTFTEVPPIEVALIDRPGTPFLGTGEASQGPTGAALANAVFDAVGVRLRDIPFTPARVKEALRA